MIFQLNQKINKIILNGCGTAYHSCLVAKYWFEELTTIDVEIDIASEFRYRKLKFDPKTIFIFLFLNLVKQQYSRCTEYMQKK